MRLFEESLYGFMTDRSFNPTAGARRVHLVSPDCQERDQVVSTLEAAGFRVDVASGVPEARRRLLLLQPSLVLLDVSRELAAVAVPDCQDLIIAAKNLPLPVPLVLLTDGPGLGLAGELLERGASDYLIKPFSPEDLLHRLGLALRSRRAPPRLPLQTPPLQTAPLQMPPRRPPAMSARLSPGAALETMPGAALDTVPRAALRTAQNACGAAPAAQEAGSERPGREAASFEQARSAQARSAQARSAEPRSAGAQPERAGLERIRVERAGAAAIARQALDLEMLGEALASEQLLIGRSEAIRKVLEQVRLVAPKTTSVLITGETGTGKERVARAIHALSRCRNRALVSVNCGGIPANLLEDEFFGHVKGAFTDAHQPRLGRFEQAHRGTIFLDEIGDLPLELQPKLLRVLQEREIHRVGGVDTIRVDARVIAATNVDLWSRVGEGRFREDLFYRINVFPIELPPLRERREDVPLFLDFFLDRFCRRDGLARKYVEPGAEAELMARAWPGNIRELENAVEIAVIRSRERQWLTLDDFPEPRPAQAAWAPNAGWPPNAGGPPHAAWPSNAGWVAGAAPSAAHPADFKQLVSRFERDLITRVLERTNGNKSQAAEMLRLKRTTLVEKLKKLDAQDAPLDAGPDASDERLLSRLTH